MILFHWRQWPRWVQIGSAALGAACLVVVIIWMLPSFLTRHPHIASASDQHKAISDTRTGLIAAVVAAGAAGGIAYTARTYRLSREGHFTDRYSKAVEQLGDDKLEVRLGGIYALERLMADSVRDQPTILEVLAAWIREQTTSQTPVPHRLATDVQAALTVIGRRSPVVNERPIDLRQATLAGAQLFPPAYKPDPTIGAHFEGAYLYKVNLDDAYLLMAQLDNAWLSGAQLKRANLSGANLEGVHLYAANLDAALLGGTNLKGSDLRNAHLEGASFGGAHLEGARLEGAHLEGATLALAQGLSQSQIEKSYVDEDTKLPEGLHPPGDPPPHVG